MVVGAGLVTIGVLGFVPGATTRYGKLAFAGHGSGAKLLGVFQVSILQNLLYVAGVAGLALGGQNRARAVPHRRRGRISASLARRRRQGGGWIPTNQPDNWLRLGIGCASSPGAHAARPWNRPRPERGGRTAELLRRLDGRARRSAARARVPRGPEVELPEPS